ncbi:gastric triacylglycerol lipase [Trichonephila inaurata madagascariensis]|uniref:Gastric triacylglycerol lipase n=1 Tax=Trichonephila inaurata madagascariensis TaxID=2747483 RepID=A0A8X7BX35_9ARAC|nr:gastric triacylglycerol lipase [Trichonephila inaurata madagascariensis]
MNLISLLIWIGVLLKGHDTNSDLDFLDVLLWDKDPDFLRNVTELISSKGYPVENHWVETEDGYILSVQRIPSGRKKWNGLKQVVFLQHGLLSSATDWVLNFPEQSLAFILADAGYDVWLGNIRGNTYSRRHVKYTPNSEEFWQFRRKHIAPVLEEF